MSTDILSKHSDIQRSTIMIQWDKSLLWQHDTCSIEIKLSYVIKLSLFILELKLFEVNIKIWEKEWTLCAYNVDSYLNIFWRQAINLNVFK